MENFFGRHGASLGKPLKSPPPLCGASDNAARIPGSRPRTADRLSAHADSSLNARGHSIIVGVCFEAKLRVVRACERKQMSVVHKKILAIQLHGGQIAHSIALLV